MSALSNVFEENALTLKNQPTYSRSRPVISVSGSSGTRWNAKCQVFQARSGSVGIASGRVIPGMPASSRATPCRRSWYLRASEKATQAPMSWAASQYFGTVSAVSAAWTREARA
jgi:hypothetical protein